MIQARPLPSLSAYDMFERGLKDLLAHSEEDYLEAVRIQSEVDFYFFMRHVLSTSTILLPDDSRALCNEFVYVAARSIQDEWKNVLDVWHRASFKSTLKTFGLPLWFLILNPSKCLAIISITEALATKHFNRIMIEMQTNMLLPRLWPDVFYYNPAKEATRWSEKSGMTLRQWAPRTESTIDCSQLVGALTGNHYDLLLLDDLVDDRSVTTDMQEEKNREAYGKLEGLVSQGGCRTVCGTFYSYSDTYMWLVKRGSLKLRMKPCIRPSDNPVYEELGGEPVFLSHEELLEKKLKHYTKKSWASQMLLDPREGEDSKLDPSLLRVYKSTPHHASMGTSIYILVDPSGTNSGTSDPTAIKVVGLGWDSNIYVLDMIKRVMSPIERHRSVIDMHRKWPRAKAVLVEECSGTDGTYHLDDLMNQMNYRFSVTSVSPLKYAGAGGPGEGKKRRITEAWSPPLEGGRIYVPERLYSDGVDLINADEVGLRAEIGSFPLSRQDHLLSCFALLFAQHDGLRSAPALIWPTEMYVPSPENDYVFDIANRNRKALSGVDLSWVGRAA